MLRIYKRDVASCVGGRLQVSHMDVCARKGGAGNGECEKGEEGGEQHDNI